jgi:aspartyl-tRNA(Asn)/glutamyl-tRNA(Gln) amidotransferase subunit C
LWDKAIPLQNGGLATKQPMAIETAQLHHLAHLARLDLPTDEEARLAHDLDALLGLIAQLQNAPVEGVRPMAHPHEVSATLRPDRVSEADRLTALEAIAPEMQSGLFLVPKVIE